MILEYVHTAFQRETYDVDVYGFVEEEEGNNDARGRRIDHMTTFLAQTVVPPSVPSLTCRCSRPLCCSGKLPTARTGQNSAPLEDHGKQYLSDF